jgi:hypothetical protein
MPRVGLRKVSEAEAGLEPSTIDYIARMDVQIRHDVSGRITRIFVYANIAVLATVLLVILIDAGMLIFSSVLTPRDRIIDRGVIKTLIGAAAVQVGVIMTVIVRYLFPKPASASWWGRLTGS